MTVALISVDIHEKHSVTLHGLSRIIRTMRWDELQAFADALENTRSNLRPKSATRITATHVFEAAEKCA
jgi:hypothetical protein